MDTEAPRYDPAEHAYHRDHGFYPRSCAECASEYPHGTDRDASTGPAPVTCEWFCTCENTTDGMVLHPILGYVATCARCAEMLELDRVDLDRDRLGCNGDGSVSLARAMARRNVQLILDGANADEVMAATRAKVAQIVAERNEVSK